ncbi:MAG: hypothetical protein V3U68_06845 [Bacteroidota bacterium]
MRPEPPAGERLDKTEQQSYAKYGTKYPVAFDDELPPIPFEGDAAGLL